MKPHPYKLRPYHNPEAIDSSKIPKGWRFRYADESEQKDNEAMWLDHAFDPRRSVQYGCNQRMTYIVPVT